VDGVVPFHRHACQGALAPFLRYCYEAQWLIRVPSLLKIKVDEPPTMPLTAEEYDGLLKAIPCTFSVFKRSIFSAEISQNRLLERFRALLYISSAETMHYAAKSIFVMLGGSCFSSILPSLLIFASSALSSAPTSMAKPVQ
jgi:hypothetical protein